MKILTLLIILLTSTHFSSIAQNKNEVYDPGLDGVKQLERAVEKSKNENKFVLVQVGGNWCSWCRKLDKLFVTDTAISKMLSEAYVVVHVNYSKENRNLEAMKELDNPERFGFPVLVILDCEGNRLHTQDSGLLESGQGHDPEKVLRFLNLWSPASVKLFPCSNPSG